MLQKSVISPRATRTLREYNILYFAILLILKQVTFLVGLCWGSWDILGNINQSLSLLIMSLNNNKYYFLIACYKRLEKMDCHKLSILQPAFVNPFLSRFHWVSHKRSKRKKENYTRRSHRDSFINPFIALSKKRDN